MLSSGTPGFWKPFFRNLRCPLWAHLTVLSKLMYNISNRFSDYLQITGYLVIYIKHMVHDTKMFLFFNHNFQWVHFLYIPIELSPQLFMSYLHRHSSDKRDILIDSMPILWDSICYDTERRQP